jgi:hypothetical protein
VLFSQTLSELAPYAAAAISRRSDRNGANAVRTKTSDRNIHQLESRQLLSVSVGSDGYTDVVKSGDSKVIYVSSSSGSDANSGTSSGSPVKSVGKAISLTRSGMPDHVLLKRGDTWRENLSWYKSGRSSSEPMLLGSYGSGERPTINAGSGTGIDISKGTVSNVVIQGIHFYSGSRNPNGGSFSRTSGGYGIRFVASTSNALIEDCQIDYFKFNLLTMPYGGGSQSNIKLRRNVVTDAYGLGGGSSGIYAQQVNNLTLEGNVFDHNGWSEKVSGAGANIYSHNAYLSEKNNNVVVKDNIFANGASHGLQTRAGGTVTGNLFLRNPIGMSYGIVNGDYLKAGGVSGTVDGNVFMESRSISGGARGWAIEVGNVKSASIKNNVMQDDTSGEMAAIKLGAGKAYNTGSGVGINNLTIENNVVHDWFMSIEVPGELRVGGSGNSGVNNLVVKNNDFQNTDNPWSRVVQHSAGTNKSDEFWSNNRYYDSSGGTNWFLAGGGVTSLSGWQSKVEGSAQATKVGYSNPNASIASYAGSYSNFVNQARETSSTNFRSTYTARNVINYIRGAFNKGSYTPPATSTPTEPTDTGSIKTDWTKPTVTGKGTSSGSIWVSFSEDVTASLSAADLVVKNNSNGATVSGLSYKKGNGNSGVWWWPNYNGGYLPKGNYTATIAAGNVKDAAGNTLASNWSTTFSV